MSKNYIDRYEFAAVKNILTQIILESEKARKELLAQRRADRGIHESQLERARKQLEELPPLIEKETAEINELELISGFDILRETINNKRD